MVRRQAVHRVAGGDAVGIVGQHHADDLVGRQRQPHLGEHVGDHVEAPEEVVGPLEALLRVALAAEEPGLPRIVRGDAGHAGEFALVGHRIGRVGRRRGDHDVDLVVVDELRRHFRRAVRIRLAVPVEDLDGMFLAGDHDAVAQNLAHALGHPFRRLAECGDRAGFRRDHADLDGLGGRARRLKHPRRGDGAGAAGGGQLDQLAAVAIDLVETSGIRPLFGGHGFILPV